MRRCCSGQPVVDVERKPQRDLGVGNAKAFSREIDVMSLGTLGLQVFRPSPLELPKDVTQKPGRVAHVGKRERSGKRGENSACDHGFRVTFVVVFHCLCSGCLGSFRDFLDQKADDQSHFLGLFILFFVFLKACLNWMRCFWSALPR